jgi:DNA repair protein SbcD/Mre11
MQSLRVAHVSDTHLGYRSTTMVGRDEDFATSWIVACGAMLEAKPDLILHAGDIFHHPQPSWGAVSAFLEGAAILKETKAPILMISGNHDTMRLRLKHSIFSVLPSVTPHIIISHNDEPELHRLEEIETDVVLLSHRALLNPSLRENLSAIIDRLTKDRYSILVSHGSVGSLDEMIESGSVVIPSELFDYPWSYIALGHLHIAQAFGTRGWYSGSTERCGWSDYPASPGWSLIRLSPDSFRRNQRSLPHLQMIQLPDLSCELMDNPEIITKIVDKIDDLMAGAEKDSRALIRIKLVDIHLSRRRLLQTSVNRTIKDRWSKVVFQIVIEDELSFLDFHHRDSARTPVKSVESLFQDFIDQRGYDPEFKERFLRKGLQALEDVTQEEGGSDAM